MAEPLMECTTLNMVIKFSNRAKSAGPTRARYELPRYENGLARQLPCSCQARHGPVPVPGSRCQHDGTARARPASTADTGVARPRAVGWSPLRLLTVRSRGRVGRLYKPAAAPGSPPFQTLAHFIPIPAVWPHRALPSTETLAALLSSSRHPVAG